MSASTDLTTLEKVRAYLGLTDDSADDAPLAALIDAASEAIEHHCGRAFALAERTELHDGTGTDTLLLRARPVASVASVHDDPARGFGPETALDPDRIVIYPGEGVLKRVDGVFTRGLRNVRVVHTAGYATVPPAVEQAANVLVAHFFHRGRQGADALSAESLGTWSVSYDTGDWPHQAKGLLREFRETRI